VCFQVVLDDSDSTVSVICTDSSQPAECSNILSCLSSVDAERALALVQEALARRRGAAQVRISACLHHCPQAWLLMPRLAWVLSISLARWATFFLAFPLLVSYCLACLTSSVLLLFSPWSPPSPHSFCLQVSYLSACCFLQLSGPIFAAPYCLFVLFPCPFLAGPKRRALCQAGCNRFPDAPAQGARREVQEAAAKAGATGGGMQDIQQPPAAPPISGRSTQKVSVSSSPVHSWGNLQLVLGVQRCSEAKNSPTRPCVCICLAL